MLGNSDVPVNPKDDVDDHYVRLINSNRSDRLYDSSGNRTDPIDGGQTLNPGDDVVAPHGLGIVGEHMEHEGGNANFGCMALLKRE